jgi:hypothetical protein
MYFCKVYLSSFSPRLPKQPDFAKDTLNRSSPSNQLSQSKLTANRTACSDAFALSGNPEEEMTPQQDSLSGVIICPLNEIRWRNASGQRL